MAAVKDQAIVLRRLDYSETSQVLVFLTRDHGRQRLIAKGIKRSTKKRFAPAIELLERGQLVFLAGSEHREGLGTLTEWRQAELHLGLRRDLQRLYAGQYAAEVTAAMIADGDPHPDLFDVMVGLLDSLAGGGDPLPLLAGYQVALLAAVGLWPDLTRCVICDKSAPPGRAAYFSAHQGGLICRDCEPKMAEKCKVPAAVLTALRESTFKTETAPGAFDLLNYTISQTIGRQPVLAKFVRPGARRKARYPDD